MPNPIAEKMTDNAALRSQLAELRLITGFLFGDYVGTDGNNSIPVSGLTQVQLLAANDLSAKAVVNNISGNDVFILEDDRLVATVGEGERWESPTRGGGVIKAYCYADQSCTLSAMRYLRQES